MSGPIKFGRELTVEHNGDIITTTETIINKYARIPKMTQVTESVYLEADKDILPHFLTLLDRQKAGEVDCIGLQCIRNGKTGAMRIEKSWIVLQ